MGFGLYCVKMADVDVRKCGLLALGPLNALLRCLNVHTNNSLFSFLLPKMIWQIHTRKEKGVRNEQLVRL